MDSLLVSDEGWASSVSGGTNGNYARNETMKHDIKLFSQREVADRLGVSKGTLSKWLSKNNISEDKKVGNKKLYPETIIKQYKAAHKSSAAKVSGGFSTVDFLQKMLQEKQEEINKLKQETESKDATIADLAKEFAKLANQAQQLNLTDKDEDKLRMLTNNSKTSFDDKVLASEHRNWWRRFFNK